jgi:heptosyltransferase-3
VERIVIDRLDSLGDAVLALPCAGLLKERFPAASILYLGWNYTRPLVECSKHIDGFLDWNEVEHAGPEAQADFLGRSRADAIVHLHPNKASALAARRARVPVRVGNARRRWGLVGPNRWVLYPRQHSQLHQAQLNAKMLRPLGVERVPPLDEIPRYYGLERAPRLREEVAGAVADDRVNVVLCPTGTGNAMTWGIDNYARLIEVLDPERYRALVVGRPEELGADRERLPVDRPHVVDLVGRLKVPDLVALLARCEATVAPSTGPLHIAAAFGRCAIGLYSPRPTKYPARWGPLGAHAHALVADPDCPLCLRRRECDCIRRIPLTAVADLLRPLAPGLVEA